MSNEDGYPKVTRTIKNGNPCFNGNESSKGKGFKKGVPKTEEQKQQIREGMLKAKTLRQLADEICNKYFAKIIDLDVDNLQNKEIIDIFKEAVKMSGCSKQENTITGNVDVQKTFASTKEIKEAVNHIKSIIK